MAGLGRDKFAPLLCAAGLTLLLAGCGGGLNPFKKEEERLPGERVAVVQQQDELKIDPTLAKTPVALPAPARNADWTQPGGVADNTPGHLQLGGGLATVWRADAGAESSDKGRLTASPIVYQNRVFALDAEGNVSAFNASGGGRVWRISLAPGNERGEEGFGGGLAIDEGRLYVTTGFGTVVALNPGSGAVLWSRRIGVPIRSSPTAIGGKVYFVTTESRLICLSGKDGEEIWAHRGIPEPATLLSNVSPAVTGNVVVVPYPAGDVIAFDANAGKPIWVESLARRQRGTSLGKLSDPARPVVDRGIMFAVGHGGRMVATALANGARLWTKTIHGTQMPWVAGDTVFVVDIRGKLLALTRAKGQIRWAVDLPNQPRWNGPVLASGRLWLVSSAGLIVGVDAKTGRVATQRKLGDTTFIAPVVASGRMYILSDKARLYALN